MAGDGTVEFECPGCQGVTRVPAAYAGKQGKCPRCKMVIEVPSLDEARGHAPAPAPRAAPDEEAGAQKACPSCGESVAAKAVKCRHCGEWLDGRVRDARSGQDGSAVHLVLRIWGVIIAGLSVLALIGNVLVLFSEAQPGALIGAGINVAIIRCGMALTRGERAGVVGVMALAALGYLGAVGLGVAVAAVVGVVIAGVVSVLYLPPVIVGVMNWEALV